MEAGAAYEAAKAQRRAKARRRAQTRTAVFVVLIAAVCRVVLRAAVARAAAEAVRAGEQCWPLAGSAVSAVVVVRPQAPPTLLWRPHYVRDESPGDVIRAHERSVLCPGLKTRIRPKRVNVSHFPWKVSAFSDKHAVCITHYVDFFATGAC